MSFDNSFESALAGNAITQEQVTGDIVEAGRRTYTNLSAADQVQANMAVLSSPALQKFIAMTPQIMELRTQYENEALSAADEQRMQDAITTVFAQYGVDPETGPD